MTTPPTPPGDHHGDLPARAVSARSSGRWDHPILLTIGVAGRDGRADGAAHGVLLTGTDADRLVHELAHLLGLVVMSEASFRADGS
jgi:hypothetical protein